MEHVFEPDINYWNLNRGKQVRICVVLVPSSHGLNVSFALEKQFSPALALSNALPSLSAQLPHAILGICGAQSHSRGWKPLYKCHLSLNAELSLIACNFSGPWNKNVNIEALYINMPEIIYLEIKLVKLCHYKIIPFPQQHILSKEELINHKLNLASRFMLDSGLCFCIVYRTDLSLLHHSSISFSCYRQEWHFSANYSEEPYNSSVKKVHVINPI